MYAVVSTGGKQVRVSQGDVFRTEHIDKPIGDTVELDKVVLLAKDEGVVVARNDLQNVKVVCEVTNQDRAKKIRVFKTKRRKGYRRTKGHRQYFTELRVREIVA
jgi:large subunit ribosomal protein L21